MKKFLKTLILAALAAVVLVACAACASPLKEVAGTYEMSSVSGSIGGITITKNSYEYFRIILDEQGNGTVQSKGKGVGAVAYEAKGTYTYEKEEGKIKMTTTNGSATATEEYNYADGVITYSVSMEQMNFTIKFTKVTAEE